MSLVVANLSASGCFVVGDTKLTSSLGEKISPTQGMMKIAIVSPSLCVAFSGNVYFADRALKTIRSQASASQSEIIQLLIQFHMDSARETDFLVAFATSPNPSLFEIKNGRVSETGSAWIGDQGAFDAYQERFHDPQVFERRDNNTNVSAVLKVLKVPDQTG